MKQFIREIVSVIIGILVALFINNWNEDRKDKEYLDQIFSSIDKELEESLTDIERVIPKQLESADSLQAYLNTEELSIYDIIIKADGVHAPSIKTNAWNAIANSKIELIAYEKLSALADIEERKENLKWRLEKQMDFMFKNMEETDRGKKEMLMMTIRDMVGAEKELQAEIEALLNNEPASRNE
ncbi:DUF6090 family protein [Maribacter sp. 2308TA10-17]|uniref:DUF6090 family protein n=1 Tax=Maribacter sp. 2308TA10-17 TaxID=3386276 RepID=UPI0039BC6E51